MRRGLVGISCMLIVLAVALVPIAPPARADTIDKIDPALLTFMNASPLSPLPVIVEMQPPAAPFVLAPNVGRANEALDLLRIYGTPLGALSLIDSAAGFANAASIAGNGGSSAGEFVGIAPQANIVDVRVLDSNGRGRISSLVRGMEWVVGHRSAYNIRVVNLSFGAHSSGSYRTDPLAAAVEVAWRVGLVVVAASGNAGPQRDTVVTPGTDPYVIPVGATDDLGTLGTGDDTLAWFSSCGSADSNPKPDLVAPGRRIVSLRVPGSTLDVLFPDRVVVAQNGATYFRLSGTSMATAVVSGATALLLQRRPNLTPDQVKALLVGSTQPFGAQSGSPLSAPRAAGSRPLDVSAAAATSPSGGGTIGMGAPVDGPLAVANRGLRPAGGLGRSLFPVVYRTPLVWENPHLGGVAW